MTVQDFELFLLAMASWREAEGCSVDVMLCVAHTIFNLSAHRDLSISQAIVEHQKLHGIVAKEEHYPDVREPVFTRLLQRIGGVTGPFREDLTNGAEYYLDLSKEVPKHMRYLLDKPDSFHMCAVSGSRHFFKEITLDTHPIDVP